MKTKTLVLSIVYLLVAAHFIFSNFVRVIGANYPLRSNDPACEMTQITMCIHSCPAITSDTAPPFDFKGFPFATNGGVNNCNLNYTPLDVDSGLAISLNYLYITLVTTMYVLLFRHLSSRK